MRTIPFKLALAIPLAGALATAATTTHPDSALILPGAAVEAVFTGGVFLEGPAAAPDGTIYFADITGTFRFRNRPTEVPAGHIRRFDPRTRQTTVFRSPSGTACGIAFAPNGQMYVTEGSDFGGRRVTRTDMRTGLSYIAAGLFNGRSFNSPNDLTIDRQGRIYFTDPRYLGHEPMEQPIQGVYRIDPDAKVTLVAADSGKPNGITLSPDERTLYVASVGGAETDVLPGSLPTRSILDAILAYPVQPGGSLGPGRILVDFSQMPVDRIGPDGITVDESGNIYATHAGWKQAGVCVFSPDGSRLGFIPLPKAGSNVEFGRGVESNVLYVTAWDTLYRVPLKTRGWHNDGK